MLSLTLSTAARFSVPANLPPRKLTSCKVRHSFPSPVLRMQLTALTVLREAHDAWIAHSQAS